MNFPSLKEFVEAMGVAWPIAFATLIGSTAVLVANHFGVSYVASLYDWVLTVLFIVALFAASICATEVVRAIGRGIKAIAGRRDKKRLQERRKKWLLELPDYEASIMRYLYSMRTQAFPATYGEEKLVGLVQKGLVGVQNGSHSVLDWPHYIPDYIWETMTENHDKFFIPNADRIRSPLSRW